jgi:hypothetical protein
MLLPRLIALMACAIALLFAGGVIVHLTVLPVALGFLMLILGMILCLWVMARAIAEEA